jgi:hypothetical protein
VIRVLEAQASAIWGGVQGRRTVYQQTFIDIYPRVGFAQVYDWKMLGDGG